MMRLDRYPTAGLILISLIACETGETVNDIHSALNETKVHRIVRPTSVAEIQSAIRTAGREGRAVSIAGGRHAMGGQQFGIGTLLLDMSAMDRILEFDRERGIIELEAGVGWPALLAHLSRVQEGEPRPWGVAQKQTGADRFTIGGSLSANIHSRGLTMRPLISDVESFTLVGADGIVRLCSREENHELFSLAAGGYGLFGVIATVVLRLVPRQKLERVVEVRTTDGLVEAFEERIRDGYTYGDFQFSTDEGSEGFLRRGIFACYKPVDDATPISDQEEGLDEETWRELTLLAHTDRAEVYEVYRDFYRSTDGQIYWSDDHQLSIYIDGYHRWIDEQTGARDPGSEMITELYIPRGALIRFLDNVREDFIEHDVPLIYGTIRMIEKDDESFLAWAKERFACVIFNLHVDHTPEGVEKAAVHFRRLIDHAIAEGGSYFLTYHRWASRRQVETCYPQFAEFLKIKRKYDPQELFQSEWYRHYRTMFGLN